ncbi:MAG: UDP-N-acetylmuramoyl-L-alanine--D-glutamate ligase, partial [Clostridia bacterium]|nr:UDP-N-acetylmuramoyl-L-alanine--D-glutamate ligase [Clostridia bacterium]
LTGATAPKIKDAILRCPSYTPERLTVAEAPDLVGAVGVAQALARTGGCVLLSPACASFDAFRDFRERGALFCNTVRSLH